MYGTGTVLGDIYRTWAVYRRIYSTGAEIGGIYTGLGQ